MKKKQERESEYTVIGCVAGIVILLFYGLGLFDWVNASYFFWIAVGSGTILNGALAGVSFSRGHKTAGITLLLCAAGCLCLFLYQVIYMMEGIK